MEPSWLGCCVSSPFSYSLIHPFVLSAMLTDVLTAFLIVVTKYMTRGDLRKEGRKGLFWVLVQEDILLMGKAWLAEAWGGWSHGLSSQEAWSGLEVKAKKP